MPETTKTLRNTANIHISREKVLPIHVDELAERLYREKGHVLVSPDDFEIQYARDAFLRGIAYRAGKILTSGTGIDHREYRRLDYKGVVAYDIDEDAFCRLYPENRSVRIPGDNAVLASVGLESVGRHNCLILRADINRQEPVRYAYTIDRNRSRASALAESLRDRN